MKTSALCFSTVILVFAASAANAALATFTDRAAWQAAAGGAGDLFENFDSFLVDTFYGTGMPVTAGFVTFEVVAGTSDHSWLIDALPVPVGPSIADVNGTPYAVTLGIEASSFGDTLVTFGPVRAFGFDYAGASYSTVDGILSTSLGDSFVIPELDHGEVAFIGLLYTAGETFTSLKWDAGPLKTVYRDFAMGVDNVEAFSPVPVPAAVWLFGSAVVGLLFGRRLSIGTRLIH